MNRFRRKRYVSSPTVEPIFWRHGWEKFGGTPDGSPIEAGERPLHREDPPRFGVEHRVELSTEPTMIMGDGSTEQQYLNTYLMRVADNDTPARVFIGYNEAHGRPATLEEARRFALEILALVDRHEL